LAFAFIGLGGGIMIASFFFFEKESAAGKVIRTRGARPLPDERPRRFEQWDFTEANSAISTDFYDPLGHTFLITAPPATMVPVDVLPWLDHGRG
jgi:hypothetical protein